MTLYVVRNPTQSVSAIQYLPPDNCEDVWRWMDWPWPQSNPLKRHYHDDEECDRNTPVAVTDGIGGAEATHGDWIVLMPSGLTVMSDSEFKLRFYSSDEQDENEATLLRRMREASRGPHVVVNFRAGVYLHYKGELYEADHLLHDADIDERIGVHYIGLQVSGAHTGPRYAVRTAEWFLNDVVVVGQGETAATFQRFRWLGAMFGAWMPDIAARQKARYQEAVDGWGRVDV